MYIKLRLLCICLLLIFTSSSYADENNVRASSEIQVLIDVSGSMKQNDPKNLRISALKLLINLLPDGVRAGIWLFAEKTQVLVETGVVNKQWKGNALKQIRKIHSRGLFTNIEEAIQKSAQQWFKTPRQQQRHLILLTDGMVDISKDMMQSAESRERVMMDQVPLLQQAGVKVQAIALSQKADAELLDKLAFDTDGWSETAQTAEQLQKVFFKIFKKVAPQDTLPIKGNKFTVDGAVKELSILVFKNPGAPVSQLITPDNDKIMAANNTAGVTWLSEKNYDLITVKKPAAGEWEIVADMDPDSQVMIVTDLKLEIDGVPNYIGIDESFDVTAFFTEKELLINSSDFLSLIDISVEQTKHRLRRKMQAVKDKKGQFSIQLGAKWAKGTYTLRFVADGKTFQRQREKIIQVVDSPIVVKIEVNKKHRNVKIQLVANESIINKEMMTAQAIINQTGTKAKTVDLNNKEGNWEIVISAGKGVKKIINFSVLAKTIQGSSITPSIKPVIIDDSLFIKRENKEEEKVADKRVEIIAEEKEIDEVETEEVVDEKEPINWLKTSAIVIAVNIVIFIGGFFGFKWLKNKAAEKQAQLLDRLA